MRPPPADSSFRDRLRLFTFPPIPSWSTGHEVMGSWEPYPSTPMQFDSDLMTRVLEEELLGQRNAVQCALALGRRAGLVDKAPVVADCATRRFVRGDPIITDQTCFHGHRFEQLPRLVSSA